MLQWPDALLYISFQISISSLLDKSYLSQSYEIKLNQWRSLVYTRDLGQKYLGSINWPLGSHSTAFCSRFWWKFDYKSRVISILSILADIRNKNYCIKENAHTNIILPKISPVSDYVLKY